MRVPPTLSLILAPLLAGCVEGREGPVVVGAIGGEPRILDPNRAVLDSTAEIVLGAVAQGLVRLDSGGEIEPGLAQRWIVSDDGLRYTFRLRNVRWPDGTRVTAQQVAARLEAAAHPRSINPLKPILGAIDEIEPMTDDVIEISLKAPRPNFLHLLAQPQMAVLRGSDGWGPYRAARRADGGVDLSLASEAAGEEDEEAQATPPIALYGEKAATAVARFAGGNTDALLGGTLADLPLARAAGLPGTALRFDPVSGMFGLMFVGGDGPFSTAEARQALSMAIDRQALVARLAVPGLQPRESLLPVGVEGMAQVSVPSWTLQPLPERRAAAAQIVRDAANGKPLALRVAVPDAPGYRLVFAQLRRDWAAIGVDARPVPARATADLRLIDEVAPASLASWYLRHFECASSRICDKAADEMMAAARLAPGAAVRRSLLANADRILVGLGPFIPLAAPVRWSLAGPRATGLRSNPFARHPLGELVPPGR